ncbi:MAG TPA: DNA polymerase III subunit delta [Patescibacteria group bacterium]|nr:DNA polymerase III subunit delta [Patescibacteria group bacterium]
MNSVFLIHGEDDYLAREKLNFFKQGFIKKYGDLNISVYNNENIDLDGIMNDVVSAPFLSEKKMIILEGILTELKKDDRKKFIELIKKVPDTSVFFIYENRNLGDKKTKNKDIDEIIKSLRAKNIFEFKKISEFDIAKYIQQKIRSSEYKMDSRAINTLATLVGPNTRQIDNEIKKLFAYKFQEKEITADDVLNLVKANVNKGVFDLTDALAKKDLKESQKIIKHLVETGENPISILGMITFHFRNLLLVKLAQAQKLREGDVIKETGMHPFVYKKTTSQSRGFDMNKIKEIYHKICQTDFEMKTGEKEPELAIDLLIAKICM